MQVLKRVPRRALASALALCLLLIGIGAVNFSTAALDAEPEKYSVDLPISGERDDWMQYVVASDNVKVGEQSRGYDTTEQYYLSPVSAHSSGTVTFRFDAGDGRVFDSLNLRLKGKAEGANATPTQFQAFVGTDGEHFTQVLSETQCGQTETNPDLNITGLAAGASTVYVKVVLYATSFADWARLYWVRLQGQTCAASQVKTYTPSNPTSQRVVFNTEEGYTANLIESFNTKITVLHEGWGDTQSHCIEPEAAGRGAYMVFKFDAGEGKVFNALRATWRAGVYWDYSFAWMYASSDGQQWNLMSKESNNGGSEDEVTVNLTSVAAGHRYLYIRVAMYKQENGRSTVQALWLRQIEGNYVDVVTDPAEETANTPGILTTGQDINPVSDTNKNLVASANIEYVKDKNNGGTADYDNFHPAVDKKYGYAIYRFDTNQAGNVLNSEKISYKIRAAGHSITGLLASTDGQSWTLVRQFDGNGNELDTTYINDLTGIAAGHETLWIKFVMLGRDIKDHAWVRYINMDAHNGDAQTRAPQAGSEGDLQVTAPDKTKYLVDQERTGNLDLTGMTVKTADGTELDASRFFVDDRPMYVRKGDKYYTKTTVGTYTLPVIYLDANGVHKGSFNVKLIANVGSIAVTSEPTKKAYLIGETLDPAGLEITWTKADGSTETLDSTRYTLSGFSSETAGNKTVTVSFAADEDTTLTAEFTVAVVSQVATGLRLELPQSLTLATGTRFPMEQLKVFAQYEGGVEREIAKAEDGADGYTVTDVDFLLTGEQTVTVQYSGLTETFTVTYTGPTYTTNEPTDTSLPWEMGNANPDEELWLSHMVGKTAGLTSMIVPAGEGWGENIRWRLCPATCRSLEGIIFRLTSEKDLDVLTLGYKGPNVGRTLIWTSVDDGATWTLAHSKSGYDDSFQDTRTIDLSAGVKGARTVLVKLELYVDRDDDRNDLTGISWLEFRTAKIEEEGPTLNFELDQEADETRTGASLPFSTYFETSTDLTDALWSASGLHSMKVNPNWDSSIQNYLMPKEDNTDASFTLRFDAPENATFGNTLMKFKGRAYGDSVITIRVSRDNVNWQDVQTLTQDNGNEFQTERKILLSQIVKDWDTMYLRFDMHSVGGTDRAEFSWLALSSSFSLVPGANVERYAPFNSRFGNTDYLNYVIANDGIIAGSFYDINALTAPDVGSEYEIVFQIDAEENQTFEDVRMTYSGRAIMGGYLAVLVSSDGGETWTEISRISTDGQVQTGAGDYGASRAFNISQYVDGTDTFQVKVQMRAEGDPSWTALTFLKVNAGYAETDDPDHPVQPGDPDAPNTGDVPAVCAAALVLGALCTAVVLKKKKA